MVEKKSLASDFITNAILGRAGVAAGGAPESGWQPLATAIIAAIADTLAPVSLRILRMPRCFCIVLIEGWNGLCNSKAAASMNPNRIKNPYVLVIGSANVDVSASTDVLPLPGETVIGDASLISVGGKGANQAAAAAMCGCATRLVAKVGEDEFGRMVRSELASCRVDLEHIQTALGERTGLAAIYVARSGQNCIVVVPGANALLTPIDLQAIDALLAAAAILVLQCEIPLPTVYRAIELAAHHQVPVILNPAPRS
jgi:hypothetical protein